VLELINGLRAYPASLYRARWLAEHPADEQDGPAELSFFGWSQDSALLLRIHNFLAAQAAGKDKKLRRELVLDGPRAKRKPRLFAPTLADFDERRFMEVIASGKV
jgi:hypothetical protein